MAKKVVISGYYGFGNFGDELILSILTQHLKKLGTETVVLSSNPRNTSMEHFVNAVRSFDFHQVSGLIKQSDVLISGGGSLLQDVTSIKSLLYYLWVIYTALRYKKDVIIFAQGIGPIRNIIAKLITKYILRQCTYISVRDHKSQNLLDSWEIKSDLVCDPAFSLTLQIPNNKGVVGIQLRNFPTMNDTLLIKLARQIVKDYYNNEIRIFSLQNNIDLPICKKFESMLRNLNPEIKTKVITEDIIQNIYQLEYMIGMRFHALIVALKAGIKSIGINYDIKVEKLANAAGIPLISMDASEDFDEVFKKMKTLDSQKIKEFVDNQQFYWESIDRVLS